MILITGGSGFIGSHFHNALDNANIINLDLVQPFFPHSSEFIQGDIRKEQDVTKAVSGKNITTVISLAAKHHDFGIGHDEYFDTNEDGTRVLCKVCSDHNIKEIIFFSSVAVYGIRDEISTETMSPAPDSPYGKSKLAGEKVLVQWAGEDPSRKVIIIRPTLVFGINNKANMFNLIRQIDSGFYFHLGGSDNIKSIGYVENLVQAALFLKRTSGPGLLVYNYADEPQMTSREISNIIAAALGRKIRLAVPRNLAIMMGYPFDLIIKLTGKNLPISSARIKKLGTSTHHSAKKLFTTGYIPTFTSVQGLQIMVEWYKSLRKQRI